MSYDEIKKQVLGIVSNKKYQWVATILVLFVVLMMSSSIRLSNWDLLTDSTTGEKIPLALDPYYFLRVAETIAANDGGLPEFDEMRVPGFETAWHSEIMPQVVVWMWKASGVFGDYTLREVNVFSPVLFYVIGLVLFFILVYVLTRSKFAGLLAATFLAFTPAYLYRTMAGFSDHEAIGMVGFFAAMLGFALALKYMERTGGKNIVGAGVAGGIVGVLTALTISLWGGVSVFLFMIIPIAFLLFWILNTKDKNSKFRNSGILFYICWMVFTVLFSMVLGFDAASVINKFLSSNGIFSAAVFGFIILDRLLMSVEGMIKYSWYNKKYRLGYTALLAVIAGTIVLPLIGKNFFGLVWEILNRLLDPLWNSNRVNTTVAENAQPYLVNWIRAAGVQIFWLFVAGMVLIGVEFSKNIKSVKRRYFMILGVTLMIFGVLFSRISPDSILNGGGILTLSGLVYLGGLAIFVYIFFKNYFESEINISSSVLILFSWMFVMLVVGRSTTRMFFVIAPFMCLCASYFIVTMFRYLRTKKLDDISKVLVVAGLIISVVAGLIAINGSYNSIVNQAQYTGPSANVQWQGAMAWVRDNTDEDSLFSHWWDYGYWVQTLGERATTGDGGHTQGVYGGNHKVGRYVLTTPYPETALSFFKTMDVDYLLIDPTDLGKYPAYSKIGGGNDAAGETRDRYSAIPVMPNDPKQTVETANGTRIVFSGGMYLFEDIIYEDDGRNVFLPAGKAAIVAVVMNLEGGNLKQPTAVYVYNNVQTRLPVRYVYVNGELIDFGGGLDVVVDIIPAIKDGRVNPMGAVIYLSQKVSKSLFTQMFLLDDAFGNYEDLKLVHVEDDVVVASLKAQGAISGNFVYYNGFRGPIKIWDVSEVSEGINVVPEFREADAGEYGTLDGLDFGVSG